MCGSRRSVIDVLIVTENRPPAGEPSPPPGSGLLHGRRVLVVDDDGQVRALMARQLNVLGMDVETADGGAEAIAKLDHGRYDALLLDLDMPGVTGLDVLLHVQRNAPALPVLVVTGTYEAERIEGAVAVLSKPFEAKELRATLEDALRNAGAGA
jgi:CheY-like chemotaxis protein